MLHIYNSLSKQKETFKPIVPGKVGIYVCGVTVYDFCHIGHARTYLIFDMVVRYLRYRGYDVKYVRNITDIDDKIIKRAQENNESFGKITKRFIYAMHEDEKALNIISPTLEPKATEYVEKMIEFIQILIEKGFAYVASNGDVYYDVPKFKSYGTLSHRDLKDLLVGARVEVNEAKHNPLDFVLWKMAKPNEPKWPSPWGEGRPGWHTECSVMSLNELGETFDIHGGGHDLKFPHHENERAQSVAVTNKEFANIWMHVGFLQINKEKMSKSFGNFTTQRDFLKDYNCEILRYFNIASHYRSPVEYSDDTLNSATKALERFYSALKAVERLAHFLNIVEIDTISAPANTDFEKRFNDAMEDDFNTPVALSVLFELVDEINQYYIAKNEKAIRLGVLLRRLGGALGILYQPAEAFLKQGFAELDVNEIENLIVQREDFRKNKNWGEADKIRKILLEKGVILEDLQGGTTEWRSNLSS